MINSVSLSQNISFGTKPQKPKKVKNKGVKQAIAATFLASVLEIQTDKYQARVLSKAADLNPQETKEIREGLLQIIKDKGLEKKGVKIYTIAQREFNKEDIVGLKKLIETAKEAQKNGIDLETAFSKIKLVAPENKRAFITVYNAYMQPDNFIGRALAKKEKVKNFINSKYLESALNLKSGTISKSPRMQKFLDRHKIALHFNSIEKGINAIAIDKAMYLPAEKLATSNIHELGHVLTNLKPLGKFLKFASYIGILAPLVSIAAIFGNTKEEKDGEKLSPLQKTVNFTRKNAGKLMLVTFLPLLANEGMASINGAKAAKKILNPDLYKKVLKANRVSFAGYLTTAVFTSLTAFAAVKVKDFFHKKHEAKVKAYNDTLNKA